MKLKIAIGGDHAGFEYKKEIISTLEADGYEVKDFGPFSADSCDYPDYVHPLAKAVEKKEYDFGVIVCGSANGVNMVANKYENIRSAIVWETELAELARSHNDANIIAIPARFVTFEAAKSFVKIFLSTEFEGGRHERRVNKIKPQ